MTIEDLREQGVLLPEEEWGVHELETTTPEVPLAAAFVAAVGFWLMIYLGDGRLLTWIGTGLFLFTLYGITWICDRAVLQQRDKFRRERKNAAPGTRSAEGGAGAPGRAAEDGARGEDGEREGGAGPPTRDG